MRPAAGECWKPWPLKPAIVKKPATSGEGPMIGLASGVIMLAISGPIKRMMQET